MEDRPLVRGVQCLEWEGMELVEVALAGVAVRDKAKVFFLAFVWPSASSVQEFGSGMRWACFD